MPQKQIARRTPQQQLAHLDAMFGVGQGAKKEREKLRKRIAQVEAEAKAARK